MYVLIFELIKKIILSLPYKFLAPEIGIVKRQFFRLQKCVEYKLKTVLIIHMVKK